MIAISKNYKIVLYFFLIVPLLTILTFWLNLAFGINFNYSSYIQLILFLSYFSISANNRRFYFIYITTIFLSIFYTILYKGSIVTNTSYFLMFGNIYYSLYYFSRIEPINIYNKKFQIIIFLFSLFFIVNYEFSIPFSNAREGMRDINDNIRVYREGFVISHVAAYYISTLAFLLYKLKYRVFAVFLWVYTIFLGARIGILYSLIGIFFVVMHKYKLGRLFYNFVLKNKKRFILFVIATIFLIFYLVFFRLSSDQLLKLTSFRSVLWSNAILQIYGDGFSIKNLIGRGPLSSFDFNKETLGPDIWMHNDFIEIAFNLGLPFLLFYVYTLLRHSRRIRSDYFLMIFLFSAFFNGFFYYNPTFIIICTSIIYKFNQRYSDESTS